MRQGPDMECRFCFEKGPLIFPCSCTTGLHPQCLSKWLKTRTSREVCEVCLTPWDIQHLTCSERCGPAYVCFSLSTFVVALYLCLLGSFILCNVSMASNVLEMYVFLELGFHFVLGVTCCVFSHELRFRLWLILRISFTGWPSFYLIHEWLELTSYVVGVGLRPVFQQWKLLGLFQVLYLIVVPLLFCQCSQLRLRRRTLDWEPMTIGVI